MAKSAAERMREYRARKRTPRQPETCAVCGAEFTPVRSDARYCGDSCRVIAHQDRVALGAELAAERGLGPVAAKVVELAMLDRRGGARPKDAVEQIGTRFDWLVRLVHERQRYGPFAVSGADCYKALARWLDQHPDADLKAAEQELRRLHRALGWGTFRLPRREESGARGYQYPGLSEHAFKVLHDPARRAAIHRGSETGDCAVVALATVLGVTWAEARRLYGGRRRCAKVTGEILAELGIKAEWEYLREGRVPLRKAGERWPTGRHLLHTKSSRTSGHVAALIEGRVDDWAAESGEQVVSVTHLLDAD